jgi:dTDP-4-amino-4,6-dideoxygalactose transaminase
MKVPFLDVKRRTVRFRDSYFLAIERVLKSSHFIFGSEIEALEQKLARFIGVKHAVGCASGTDAITLSLMCLGLPKGTEVITQANTCVPTVTGILRAGLVPVLAEIDSETCMIDPKSVQTLITPKTRVLLPVHLYGNSAPVLALKEIAKAHDLFLIEDGAQSIGATLGEKKLGSFGDLSCLSFYPTKNLGALGDGGMVFTDRDDWAIVLRRQRNYGQQSKYSYVDEGINSRLDELQASLILSHFEFLESDLKRRTQIANYYSDSFAPLRNRLEVPRLVEGSRSAFHLYPVFTKNRSALSEYLAGHGVATSVHYPEAIYEVPLFKDLHRGSSGVAAAKSKQVLSLPLYPEMTDEEVKYVSQKVLEFHETK